MIVVAYQRTQAGAMLRAAQRGRTLGEALPAPKLLPVPVVALEPPPSPAKRVLSFPLSPYHERRRIIDLMARMHGVTYADVLGRSRRRERIIPARQAAICAVKEWETINGRAISMPLLGRLFGGRDHTTILHAMQKRGYWEKAHG